MTSFCVSEQPIDDDNLIQRANRVKWTPHLEVEPCPQCSKLDQEKQSYWARTQSTRQELFYKDMDDYLKGCRFLTKLNNEILGERNAPYKERLSSLENLVLIMG